MALQIRRGTTAERLALTGADIPVAGELLYTTDSKKLYIGDGVTGGGLPAGYFGSVVVSGQTTLYSTGSNEALTIAAGANITLTTNPGSNTLTISAGISESSFNLKGSLFADDSTMMVDGTNGQIVGPINSFDGGNSIIMDPTYGVVIGGTGGASVIGAAGAPIYIGAGPSGSTSGTVTIGNGSNSVIVAGTLTATLLGNVTGNVNGDVTGNVTGNVNGDVTGDLYGSVYATNSSLLIDNTAGGSIYGTFRGTFDNSRLQIFENEIQTSNSNEDISIKPSGTGSLRVVGTVNSKRLELLEDIVGPGIIIGNITPTNASLVISNTHDTASTSADFVTPGIGGFPGPKTGSTVTFLRARNTIFDSHAVQANDELGTIDFNGFDGTTYYSSIKVRSAVDSISGSNIAGRLEVVATDASGVSSVKMTVSSTAITGAVPFVVPSYTSTPETRPTGVEGMIILNTTTGKFQGFYSASWVDLN